MLWPKKNSYKEFDNEKKFLRLENSPRPPPPISFLMVRPLEYRIFVVIFQQLLLVFISQLLKAQTKYLGRNWRKSNMKTMSAIYQKVRHRLNDDWAYGNG